MNLKDHATAVLLVFLIGAGILSAEVPWREFSKKTDDWYRSPEGIRIADNILSWQSDEGSWPKNGDTTATAYTGDKAKLSGTFDNSATVGELRFLARAFRATKDARYEQAFLKGFGHILKAQPENVAGPEGRPEHGVPVRTRRCPCP